MASSAPTADELETRLAGLHADAHGWALSCCGWDHAEAEDIVQTTYVKVLSGQARWSGRSSFRTWLLGVVRFTALERRRREASLRRRAEEAARNADGPDGPSPSRPFGAERTVMCDERARRLRTALSALPDRQREVLHLVFYQGLSVAEASTAMDVSVGSARTHYHRGKQRLRSLLSREDLE